MKENIIKTTLKELNLTYKELADILGYEETSLRTIANRENVTTQLINAINLYKENRELKKDVATLKEFIQLINKYNKI